MHILTKDYSQWTVAVVRDGHPARHRERDREQGLGAVLFQADEGCLQRNRGCSVCAAVHAAVFRKPS